MAYVKVTKSDTFETWRQKTNEVGAAAGDYPLLYKNATVNFTGITGQPPAGYGGSTVAVFSIAATAGVYSITAITTAGLGYNVNDVITVYGSDLGGIKSTHDMTITVDSLDGTNGIATASVTTGVGASNLVSESNQSRDELGSTTLVLTTTATDIKAAINELDLRQGNATLTTTANDLSDAVNELDLRQGNATLTTTANDLSASVNELDLRQGNATLTTTANDLSAAINEHDAELGLITAAALNTTASTVSTAINEVSANVKDAQVEIGGDMLTDYQGNIDSSGTDSIIGTLNNLYTKQGTATLSTTASDISAAVNELDTKQGAATLTTSASTISGAINQHDAELGTISAAAMGTVASTVSGAIAEHETQIGDEDITGIDAGSNTITGALVQHDTELGTISAVAMGTTASTVSTAIKEHEDQIGNEDITSIDAGSNTITGALNQLHGEVGSLSLNTSATNLTAALNELEADLFNAQGATKRTLTSLNTTDQTSIVDAINELHNELYVSGATFTGLSADDFTAAINELREELGNHSDLNTAATVSVVAAINELEAELFNVEGATKRTLASLNTGDKTSIVDAINEVHDEIGNTSISTITSAAENTVSGALVQLHGEVGNVNATAMGTTATNLTTAMLEVGNIARFAKSEIAASGETMAADYDGPQSNVLDAMNSLYGASAITTLDAQYFRKDGSTSIDTNKFIIASNAGVTATSGNELKLNTRTTDNTDPANPVITDTNRIRISSSNGNVGVGKAPSTYKLDVNGTVKSTAFTEGTTTLANKYVSKSAANTLSAANTFTGNVSLTPAAAKTITIGGSIVTNTSATAANNFTFLEFLQDNVASMFDSTGDLTKTYDDANGKISFAVDNDSHTHTTSNITSFAETVRDTVGDMLTGNTETRIAVTHDDATNKLNFAVDAETITTLSHNTVNQELSYVDEAGGTTTIDLSQYVDDTNLARLTSGTLNGSTGIATFTRDDSTTFTVNMSALLDDSNWARITSAAFNSSDGIITLTRNDGTTVTVDIDGRYSLDTHTHSINQLTDATTVGSNNLALGTSAFTSWVNGSGNTAVGPFALNDVEGGNNNTGVGFGSLGDVITTSGNTGLGHNSVRYNDGSNNTGIGYNSLKGVAGASGSRNTALGKDSLLSVGDGTGNIGVGYTAGSAITSGSDNTIIGDLSGSTTLSGTVLIGAGTSERVKVNTTGLYINGTLAALTDTAYSVATSSTKGLVKIGYTENSKNYPVELSSEKMYVNVPWVNTTYTAGALLDLSNGEFDVDLTELADGTADVVGTADELVYLDNSVQKRKLISEIKLGQFDNDQNWNDYSLTAATASALGGIKLEDATVQSVAASAVSTTASRTYGLQVNSSGQGVVNVPWSNTEYAAASSTTKGLVKIGYTASNKNYPVELSSEKMYVNVPWSNTEYAVGDGGLTTKNFTQAKSDTLDTIGVVLITEGSNTGVGTRHRADTPANYGNIGNKAVDLSYWSVADTTKGATGSYATALGFGTKASGSTSTAIGNGSVASGNASVALGGTASGQTSVSMGSGTTAVGSYSTAMSSATIASGWYSVATGEYTTASGSRAFSMGYNTNAVASTSLAAGYNTTVAKAWRTIMGYNGGIGTSSTAVLGLCWGSADPGDITTKAADTDLIFKVNTSGTGYFDGSADAGNADYAEYFESFDGSPLERGHFVSFVDGSDCLEYGNSNIVGIVSSSPAVVGDTQSLHYKGKYQKDEFDTYIRQSMPVIMNIHGLIVTKRDDGVWEVTIGESLPVDMETFVFEIKNKGTQEVLETITDVADVAGVRVYDFEVEATGSYTHPEIHKVLAVDFDETKEYIPRSDRPEWSPIGLLGKLWVYLATGETVTTGDYITSDTGGKAVKCLRSDADSFRVMEVNTEHSLVKVFYK